MKKGTLNIDQKEEVLLNIIMDAVIFDRMCQGISKVMNCGKVTENEIEQKYNGIETALMILGITEDSPLQDNLYSIFLKYSTDITHSPNLAAEFILIDWQEVLKVAI